MDLVNLNLNDYQFSYSLQWKQNKERSEEFLLEPIQKGERQPLLSLWSVSQPWQLGDCLSCEIAFNTICSGRHFVYGLILSQLSQNPFFLFSFLVAFSVSFSLPPLSHQTRKTDCSLSLQLFLPLPPLPPPPPVSPLLPPLRLATKNSRLSKHISIN